jgi:hypothetical protein
MQDIINANTCSAMQFFLKPDAAGTLTSLREPVYPYGEIYAMRIPDESTLFRLPLGPAY